RRRQGGEKGQDRGPEEGTRRRGRFRGPRQRAFQLSQRTAGGRSRRVWEGPNGSRVRENGLRTRARKDQRCGGDPVRLPPDPSQLARPGRYRLIRGGGGAGRAGCERGEARERVRRVDRPGDDREEVIGEFLPQHSPETKAPPSEVFRRRGSFF